jgi:spermidine/putrescine transport system ATP-binding protein
MATRSADEGSSLGLDDQLDVAGTEEAGGGDAAAVASVPVDVRLDRVTKRFGEDVVAVDDVSLEFGRGSFFALLGPSGCGKTTTLRMIGGFEEPTSGTIYLDGEDVTGLPPYRRDVNTVFQSYALFPHLSIFENVAFGLRRRGVKGGDLKRRVEQALELVGMAGLGKRKPRQLSGGQQQRIALARALVNEPRVLLLDEPLGALDLKLRRQLQLELKRIQHEVGITFIHVTHDQEEAMTMADRIAVMNLGHVEQVGTPSELYEQPATAFVAGFLGISNLLTGIAGGDGTVRLPEGTDVRAPSSVGRKGPVAVGIRPEKIRFGDGSDANSLPGVVAERSYIGVSTQYVVDTAAGSVTVYIQNADPGSGALSPGDRVILGWSPEATFVVDAPQEEPQ